MLCDDSVHPNLPFGNCCENFFCTVNHDSIWPSFGGKYMVYILKPFLFPSRNTMWHQFVCKHKSNGSLGSCRWSRISFQRLSEQWKSNFEKKYEMTWVPRDTSIYSQRPSQAGWRKSVLRYCKRRGHWWRRSRMIMLLRIHNFSCGYWQSWTLLVLPCWLRFLLMVLMHRWV